MDPIAIDDADSRIHYSGSWITEDQNPQTEDFANTIHGTKVAGAQATLEFNGTSVSVLGTVPSQSQSLPSSSTYVLDNNPLTMFNFKPTPGQAPVYQQLFYQSPTLPDGAHSLTIQSATNDSWFWLDVIVITATSGDTNLNSSSNSSQTSTPTPISSGEQSSEGSKTLTGSIVGAVIGALLVVIVAGILFFSYCRRRQRKRTHPRETVSPFTHQPTYILPMKASQPVWEGFHQSSSEPYPESVWPSQTYSYASHTHTERSRTESPVVFRPELALHRDDHRPLQQSAALRDGYLS